MYNIDWNRLISYLLPAPIRKAKFVALISAMLSPILSLDNSFSIFRNKISEEINTNGQVVKLQAGLNRNYDPIEKRITITDAPPADPVFIYASVENRPIYLPAFLSGEKVDFHVNVPGDLSAFRASIIAFATKYKLASKRFLFVYSSLPPLTGGNTVGPIGN